MTTAIVNIGQLATCPPSGASLDALVEVRHNVTLLIKDGLVASITDDDSPKADQVVDASGGAVIPGFIDAHTHLVFGGTRVNELAWKAKGDSYQDIAKKGGGILSTVSRTRSLAEDALFESGLNHLAWCLRNGTTTLEAKSGYGLDLQTELHILLAIHQIDSAYSQSVGETFGARVVPTFLGLHAVPPEANTKSEYVDLMVDEVLPLIARAGLATSVDAFIETGYFEEADAIRLATKGREFGLGLKLHVDQLSDQGGAVLAAKLGAKTADHLEHTGHEGIAALKKAGTIPVLLPASVFGLGLNHYPDARAMLETGLPVVLATDFNPGSSPTPSIPFVMALATRHMKMSPEECLAAVTVNAAKALDIADRGTLHPGKKADFTIWPFSDWREVAYWIDGPRPSQVWVNGRKTS